MSQCLLSFSISLINSFWIKGFISFKKHYFLTLNLWTVVYKVAWSRFFMHIIMHALSNRYVCTLSSADSFETMLKSLLGYQSGSGVGATESMIRKKVYEGAINKTLESNFPLLLQVCGGVYVSLVSHFFTIRTNSNKVLFISLIWPNDICLILSNWIISNIKPLQIMNNTEYKD